LALRRGANLKCRTDLPSRNFRVFAHPEPYAKVCRSYLQVAHQFESPFSSVVSLSDFESELWRYAPAITCIGAGSEVVKRIKRARWFPKVKDGKRTLCSCGEIAQLSYGWTFLPTLPCADPIHLYIDLLRDRIGR
jgi:hypothetical protein